MPCGWFALSVGRLFVAAPSIVSTDDHVLETPDIWQDRLPARFGIPAQGGRERARRSGPRRPSTVTSSVIDGRWCDVWHDEDVVMPLLRGTAQVGFDVSGEGQHGITLEEVRPGCYDVEARLADMDLNGVAASLTFPNEFVRFAGQRFLMAKDKELALLCVRAYNDWVLDCWAGPSCGRLIPLCIVPLWSPELAVEEVGRTAGRGARAGAAFTELPANLGLPSIFSGHWILLRHLPRDRHRAGHSYRLRLEDDGNLPGLVPGGLVIAGACQQHDVLDRLAGVWSAAPLPAAAAPVRRVSDRLGALSAPADGLRLEGLFRLGLGRTQGPRRPPGTSEARVLPQAGALLVLRRRARGAIDEEAGLVDNVSLEVDYPHGDSTWPRSSGGG